MNSIIFQVVSRFLNVSLHVIAIWLMLRGHNNPGGGFVAGLIAGAAFSIQALAFGLDRVPKFIRDNTLPIGGIGLFISAFSGILSFLIDKPFMTGMWGDFPIVGGLGTPMLFDFGVYIVVLSVISTMVLTLLGQEENVRSSK